MKDVKYSHIGTIFDKFVKGHSPGECLLIWSYVGWHTSCSLLKLLFVLHNAQIMYIQLNIAEPTSVFSVLEKLKIILEKSLNFDLIKLHELW